MIEMLTKRFETISQNFRLSTSPYSSSRNAVMEPFETSPNAITDKPATPHNSAVTMDIEMTNAERNFRGSCIADSTGSMMQIPSNEYKIPHNAIGDLTGLSVGHSSGDGRFCHSNTPIIPNDANPAIISTVPAIMTGVSCFSEGMKLKTRTAGTQQETTASWFRNAVTFKNWSTAYKFSPMNDRKTVQIASCCVQIHAATYD
mmetsp:Transcript_28039/g.68112  ORF Transcript_28039/g.68112 Transcript_28039/m.68112 type:complete len:202 (-) Transcript_28039:676-1281(-)